MTIEKQPPRRSFFLRARDAVTGRFIRIVEALRRPATTVVERLKGKGRNHG